ncbi:MAG TPA: hypothetical protein VGK88_04670 [bacterium]|jgi:hypothetical protein
MHTSWHRISILAVVMVTAVATGCARRQPSAAPPAPSTTAPPSASTQIGSITFARGESNGSPQDPGDHFPAGVSRVYGFFTFAGLKADDVVRGVWTEGGRQILEKHLTLPEVFSGRTPDKGTLWLWIQWAKGAPAGTFQLDISVNGTVMQSGTFVVEP